MPDGGANCAALDRLTRLSPWGSGVAEAEIIVMAIDAKASSEDGLNIYISVPLGFRNEDEETFECWVLSGIYTPPVDVGMRTPEQFLPFVS